MNCQRFNETTWYVWDKQLFSKDRRNNEDDIIPKYKNVYKVQCNSQFTECWCDISCKKLSRTGIPCAHIFKALGVCHPKMIHPRYLKIYNEDTLYFDMEIKSILDKMIQWKTDHPRKCCIDMLLPNNNIEGFGSQNSVGDVEFLSVIAAHKMDLDQKCLLSGEVIPNEYLVSAQEYLEGKVEGLSIPNDYDEFLIYNDEDIATHEEVSEDSRDVEDNYNFSTMNAFMDSCKKELDKVLKGDPHSWNIVKNDILNAIASQSRRLNEKQSNPISSTHTLVSSNGPIDRSPKGKRYKPFYEKYTK